MSQFTFEQLLGPAFTGTLPQGDGGTLSYLFLRDRDSHHLLMHSLDTRGERKSFVATKAEFKQLTEKKIAISRSEIEKHCGSIESYGRQSSGRVPDPLMAVRGDKESAEELKKDNELQTAAEARAASNVSLIKAMESMFRNPTIDCLELAKARNLPSSLTIEIPLPAPHGPASLHTLTTCAWGQLQFVITRYLPKKIIITNNDIVYDDYREFMYKTVAKSSKTSMGFGINFDIGSSLVSAGPVIGDTIFADGVEQKDDSGIGLKFDMTKIKQYYDLTIKATQRIIASSKCTTTEIDL